MTLFSKEFLHTLQNRAEATDIFCFMFGECIICPLCKHQGSFKFTSDLKRYYCNECEAQGDSISLLMTADKYPFDKALEKVARFYEIPIQKYKSKRCCDEKLSHEESLERLEMILTKAGLNDDFVKRFIESIDL